MKKLFALNRPPQTPKTCLAAGTGATPIAPRRPGGSEHEHPHEQHRRHAMEIRGTHSDDSSASSLRLDITRKNRELIANRTQALSEADEVTTKRDPQAMIDAVKAARDAYRAQHQERIANARAHYTKNHEGVFAAEVAANRATYNADMEKVLAERYDNTHPKDSADKVDLSSAGKFLAGIDDADAQRASRVAELKDLFQSGQLPSDDMIARTAYRLLGGE
jgi:hypothetical protein